MAAPPDLAHPLDDAWFLDVTTQTWHQISSELTLPARQFQSLTGVPELDQIVLIGGRGPGGAPLADVWLLDLATDAWRPVAIADGPEARESLAAAWVSASGDRPAGMIVSGGRGGSGVLADLWLLTLAQ